MDRRALVLTAVATDVWADVLTTAEGWMPRVTDLWHDADARRDRADYNTGSILVEEALQLAALAEHLSARVVLEVGTFIGTSTMALAMGSCVESVYTCDSSNDCLPETDVVRTYPKQSSTTMFYDLLRKGVQADLCFFDGALSSNDADLLRGLTHPRTVFAVHDYNYGPKIRAKGVQEIVPRKGIGNVRLLQPLFPSHLLIEPRPETTLALLVPEGRL